MNDQPVGRILETGTAWIRRLFRFLPYTFAFLLGERPVGAFDQQFTWFGYKATMDLSGWRSTPYDRRLAFAGALLLMAIEAKEDASRLSLRPLSSPPIELLYTDADVVVANKPSGLLVHRGWDNDDDVAMFRVRDAIGQHVHPLTASTAAPAGRSSSPGRASRPPRSPAPSRRDGSTSSTSRWCAACPPTTASSTTPSRGATAARACRR